MIRLATGRFILYRLKQNKLFPFLLAFGIQALALLDVLFRPSTAHSLHGFITDATLIFSIEIGFLLVFNRVFAALVKQQQQLPAFLATQLALLGCVAVLTPETWLASMVGFVVVQTLAFINVLTLGIAPALALTLLASVLFWLVGHIPSVESLVFTETTTLALLAFGRPSQLRSRTKFWNAIVVVSCVLFVQHAFTHGLQLSHWHEVLKSMGWFWLLPTLSVAFTFVLLPMVELLYAYVTPFRLLELSDFDHPLLKKLQVEAPGTFHHSLLIASLAEAAAEAIGANGLLTRVGCLFHDVGKIKRPTYFVENQAYYGIENPHDTLSPRLSKAVVVAHPSDSLALAEEYQLPSMVRAFMPEHHGTLLCGYFYHKAVQQEGKGRVLETEFRYPGPKPQSRETAIVMMADACESAVRALRNPTPKQIETLVDKLFQQRLLDGQLDECPITMSELHTVRQTLIKLLFTLNHQRVNYSEKIKQTMPAAPPLTQSLSPFVSATQKKTPL